MRAGRRQPIVPSASRPHGRIQYAKTVERGLERWIALLTAVALFVPSPVATRVSIGALLVLFLSPMILRHIRSSKGATVALSLMILTYLWAIVTALFSVALVDSRHLVQDQFVGESTAYLALVTSFGAMYWAAVTNGILRSGIAVGLGGIVSGFLLVTPEQAENPWKYVLAWPISLLAVSLLARVPALVAAIVLTALASLSLFLESRNAAGSLLLAALVIIVIKARPNGASRKRLGLQLVAFGVAAALAFWVLTTMVSSGVFGAELAQRQTRQEGVWFLGSRVEPFAAIGYFVNSPLGIGIGVAPSPEDKTSAMNSLARVASTDSGYVTERLIGDKVDLHSILATFWFEAGLVGAFAGIAIVFILVRGIVTSRNHQVIVAFVGSQAVWDLLFSPLSANGRWVGLALALVIASTHMHLSSRDDRHKFDRGRPQFA